MGRMTGFAKCANSPCLNLEDQSNTQWTYTTAEVWVLT
jgi:hypothetical protein